MIKVGTHNGVFHADDVMACAILSIAHNHEIEIIRTRNPKTLDDCTIVCDVGGVYDPANNRFDHHQRSFDLVRPNGIKYSSAGLVWEKFGHMICGQEVWEKVNSSLIQGIDALDNGQKLHSEGSKVFQGMQVQSFSSLIAMLNPTWQEPNDEASMLFAFRKAMDMAIEILWRSIRAAEGEVAAKKIVETAIENAVSGVVVLEQFVPWQETVVNHPEIIYVVFPDHNGQWMVQCAPKALGSFESRRPLPESWAGLRDSKFAQASGDPDGIFCHAGRFICGSGSKKGAIFLALKAL